MEPDILISLDDDRSQKIADAISNKTSKKILRHLTEHEGTVTDIAHGLKIPVNTTDYNIKKLLETGLIEKKDYWWSVKGKKMPTYGISNKRIIISPRNFKGKLNYIVAFVATGLIAIAAKTYEIITKPIIYTKVTMDGSINAVFEAAKDTAASTAAPVMEKVAETIVATTPQTFTLGPIGWFIIGAWFTLILLLVITNLSERRSK